MPLVSIHSVHYKGSKHLHSTMAQSRLNHLKVLHVHRELNDKLNLISVANDLSLGLSTGELWNLSVQRSFNTVNLYWRQLSIYNSTDKYRSTAYMYIAGSTTSKYTLCKHTSTLPATTVCNRERWVCHWIGTRTRRVCDVGLWSTFWWASRRLLPR